MIGVLGHSGFVGTNLMNLLRASNIPCIGGSRRNGVDARDISSLSSWIKRNQITSIVNLAAECGGIGLNQRSPAELWLASTQISSSVLEASRISNIQKLIMIGTVCSYAKYCPVPFKESSLLKHGEPEESNMFYGVAKLNGLYGAKAYYKQYGLNTSCVIPVNMYGPHDHFDLENSHVIPALIKKMCDAVDRNTDVIIWGDGSATREFLYVEDFAKAVMLALETNVGPDPVNIGSGCEISIADLAAMIAQLVGFNGTITWDLHKPNGQPRRQLDVSAAIHKLGFVADTALEDGLKKTVEWWCNNAK